MIALLFAAAITPLGIAFAFWWPCLFPASANDHCCCGEFPVPNLPQITAHLTHERYRCYPHAERVS